MPASLRNAADTSILMDPWLFGKIFNDSWSLLPEPKFDPAMLDRVDYIWISHEHPDHCHFPTLDSFPASFKSRVTILFQDRDYTKMFSAFRKLGYQRFQRLPHRTIVALSDKPEATKIYCYHAGLMDSAAAVLGQGQVMFNANDARISAGECKGILNDIGHVDVLLSQFSLAAYAGFEPHEKYLPQQSKADSRECLIGASRVGSERHDPIRELHVLFEPRQQVREQFCEFGAPTLTVFCDGAASARRCYIRETPTRSAPSTIHPGACAFRPTAERRRAHLRSDRKQDDG